MGACFLQRLQNAGKSKCPSSFLCRTTEKSETTFQLINAGVTASPLEFSDWNSRVLMSYFWTRQEKYIVSFLPFDKLRLCCKAIEDWLMARKIFYSGTVLFLILSVEATDYPVVFNLDLKPCLNNTCDVFYSFIVTKLIISSNVHLKYLMFQGSALWQILG